MRSVCGKFCFALAAVSLMLLYLLPSGSPASLAPLVAMIVFAPMSVKLWIFDAPPRTATPSIEPSAPERAETPRAPRKKGSVAKFMAARLTRADGESIDADAVFQNYRAWCAAGGLTAATDFHQRLDDLCTAAAIRRGQDQSLMNVGVAAYRI